jgi:hypothetical protein
MSDNNSVDLLLCEIEIGLRYAKRLGIESRSFPDLKKLRQSIKNIYPGLKLTITRENLEGFRFGCIRLDGLPIGYRDSMYKKYRIGQFFWPFDFLNPKSKSSKYSESEYIIEDDIFSIFYSIPYS